MKIQRIVLKFGWLILLIVAIVSFRYGITIGTGNLERELESERWYTKRSTSENLYKNIRELDNVFPAIFDPEDVFFKITGPLPNKDYLHRKLVDLLEKHGLKHTGKIGLGTNTVNIELKLENEFHLVSMTVTRTVWVYKNGFFIKTQTDLLKPITYHENPQVTNAEICDNICKFVDGRLNLFIKMREESKIWEEIKKNSGKELYEYIN